MTYLFLIIIPHISAIVFLKGVIRSITECGLQLRKEGRKEGRKEVAYSQYSQLIMFSAVVVIEICASHYIITVCDNIVSF